MHLHIDASLGSIMGGTSVEVAFIQVLIMIHIIVLPSIKLTDIDGWISVDPKYNLKSKLSKCRLQ